MGTKVTKYLSHDIIGGILYYLLENNINTVGDRGQLHQNIYKLQKQYSILKSFIFCTSGILPISTQVEESIFSLVLSHFLYFDSRYYNDIMINEKGKNSIEKNILTKFTIKEKIQLKNIAKNYDLKKIVIKCE